MDTPTSSAMAAIVARRDPLAVLGSVIVPSLRSIFPKLSAL
jgi:hypothetical protein